MDAPSGVRIRWPELDVGNAHLFQARLQEAVDDALAAGRPEVVFDLADVSFIDSAALRALLTGTAACGTVCEVVLRRVQPSVMRVLQLAGLTQIFRTELAWS